MQAAVKVEQLSKAYDNLLTVDKIDLSVKCGTAYGLPGANGTGRSAAIEYVLGTKSTGNGTASVLNCNPQKGRYRLFQKVGVQFQEGDCQPETKVPELCGEIIYLYEAPADWKSLCERFSMGSKTGNAVKSLSGGERQ